MIYCWTVQLRIGSVLRDVDEDWLNFECGVDQSPFMPSKIEPNSIYAAVYCVVKIYCPPFPFPSFKIEVVGNK